MRWDKLAFAIAMFVTLGASALFIYGATHNANLAMGVACFGVFIINLVALASFDA